jgi:septal ring factor EnvC (AmiA/AmiB activator)
MTISDVAKRTTVLRELRMRLVSLNEEEFNLQSKYRMAKNDLDLMEFSYYNQKIGKSTIKRLDLEQLQKLRDMILSLQYDANSLESKLNQIYNELSRIRQRIERIKEGEDVMLVLLS